MACALWDRLPGLLVLLPALLPGCWWNQDVGGWGDPAWCVAGDLTLGATITDTTDGHSNYLYYAGCRDAFGPEVVYRFIAPAGGYYRFTTAGSVSDTILYALDGTCYGSVLGCNADYGGTTASELLLALDDGEAVLLVVDSESAADAGEVQLLAEPVTCPTVDLGGAPVMVADTTVGRPDDHQGVCGGAGQGDRAYRFFAPHQGNYRFELVTDDPAFAGALYLEEGGACGGRLLHCNSGLPRVSRVTHWLGPGEVATVWVDGDGSEGSYILRVEELPVAGPTQEYVDEAGASFQVQRGQLDFSSTSCGDAVYWPSGATDPADMVAFPDIELYASVPPQGTDCLLRLHTRFAFTAAAYAYSGMTSPELGCVVGQLDPTSPVGAPTYDADLPFPPGIDTLPAFVVDRVIASPDASPDADGPELDAQVICTTP